MICVLVAEGDEHIKPRVSEQSERNPRNATCEIPTLKGSKKSQLFDPFRVA